MYRNHDTGRCRNPSQIDANRLKNRLFRFQQSAIFSLGIRSLNQPGQAKINIDDLKHQSCANVIQFQ